jgi:hypothetical protein
MAQADTCSHLCRLLHGPLVLLEAGSSKTWHINSADVTAKENQLLCWSPCPVVLPACLSGMAGHGLLQLKSLIAGGLGNLGFTLDKKGTAGARRSEEADPDRKGPATQATSHDTTNGVERSHCHCDFVGSLHPDYISSAADADVLLVGRALRCALQTCLICDQTMVVSQLERDGVVTKPIGVYSAHTTPAQIERHVNTR